MSRRKAFDTGLSSTGQGSGKAVAPKAQSVPSSAPSVPSAASSDTSKTVTVTEKSSSKTPVGTAVSVSGTSTPPVVDDASTCFICAEPVTYWAVGQCNHHVCHVCAIRLRVFYKMLECAYCKTLCPSLLFSRSSEVQFPDGPFRRPSSQQAIERAQAEADKPEKKGKKWYQGLILPGTLDLKDFPYSDEKLGVVFEDEEVMETSLLLLRFNCPYPDCPHMSNGWQALEKHTLAEHGLIFCKICTRQLSRFSHEQILYPPHLLALHDPSKLRGGQKPLQPRTDKEREMVKSWAAPHPMCEFCHEGFFGPDELFKHMREKHEECFVCKQLGERDVYFENYDKLEKHFNRDHYPCMQPVCIEKKFQVFGSELDLRAHMMEEHGEAMSQRDRAQARQVHLNFSARTEPGPSRAGGRGFSLSNGAPTPMREAIAPRAQQLAAPPMNNAQAAQQRRQVQTDRQDESRRRKNFVTGLTDPNRATPNPSAPASGRQSGRASPEESASGFATPREDVDDATAARHAALLSRVAMLVNDSATKLASFRAAVRQLKNNESTAKDMVDTIYHVLDKDADATAGVVREISNLFDADGERDKQRAILEAVNAFRVQQQDQFPALGGPPTGLGTNWAAVSSGRILSAKRATHTSGGGGHSRAVWDRVEAAANRPTTGINGRAVPGAAAPTSFPALGAAGPSRSSTHSTPWASGGAGSSNKAPSALVPQIRSVNYPTASTSKPKPVSQAAFPALPTSSSARDKAAERAALFTKPTARDESIARIRGLAPKPPANNTWSVSGATNGVAGLSVDDENPTPQPGGGKKKGKQKQLLFTVSARPT